MESASRQDIWVAGVLLRRIDPRWKSTPSAYETIEGAIAHQRAVLLQAEARYRHLTGAELRPAPGIGHNSGARPGAPRKGNLSPVEVLVRDGQPIGYVARGAGPEVRTLPALEFDRVLAELTSGRYPIVPDTTYPGLYYRSDDGTLIGVRISTGWGLTFEMVSKINGSSRKNLKFHRRID